VRFRPIEVSCRLFWKKQHDVSLGKSHACGIDFAIFSCCQYFLSGVRKYAAVHFPCP